AAKQRIDDVNEYAIGVRSADPDISEYEKSLDGIGFVDQEQLLPFGRGRLWKLYCGDGPGRPSSELLGNRSLHLSRIEVAHHGQYGIVRNIIVSIEFGYVGAGYRPEGPLVATRRPAIGMWPIQVGVKVGSYHTLGLIFGRLDPIYAASESLGDFILRKA